MKAKLKGHSTVSSRRSTGPAGGLVLQTRVYRPSIDDSRRPRRALGYRFVWFGVRGSCGDVEAWGPEDIKEGEVRRNKNGACLRLETPDETFIRGTVGGKLSWELQGFPAL